MFFVEKDINKQEKVHKLPKEDAKTHHDLGISKLEEALDEEEHKEELRRRKMESRDKIKLLEKRLHERKAKLRNLKLEKKMLKQAIAEEKEAIEEIKEYICVEECYLNEIIAETISNVVCCDDNIV